MANNYKNPRPCKYYDGKKFTLRNTGYYSMTTGDRMLMHRYMWEKEVGPIPDGYDIHHKNEDKTDNRIENFECLPKSLHTKIYSPHNNQYGKGNKPVRCIDLETGVVKFFSCTNEAARAMNIDRSGICMAINGRIKTYKNHKWAYQTG